MRKITVGWMFPDVLNLHGERGSVQMLQFVGKQLGLEVEIRRIEDFGDPIPFDELDILMFLPGEISSFRHLIPALEQQREALTAYIESGHYVLAFGTTGLMFGKEILREDGSVIQGLGYLDLKAKERKYVWGDDLHVKLVDSDLELIGAQIMMADVEAANPLASTIYGMGNNNTGAEGARYQNLIYTNCTGPVLVKNPRFAEMILRGSFGEELPEIQDCEVFRIADRSFQAIRRFTESKKQ